MGIPCSALADLALPDRKLRTSGAHTEVAQGLQKDPEAVTTYDKATSTRGLGPGDRVCLPPAKPGERDAEVRWGTVDIRLVEAALQRRVADIAVMSQQAARGDDAAHYQLPALHLEQNKFVFPVVTESERSGEVPDDGSQIRGQFVEYAQIETHFDSCLDKPLSEWCRVSKA